MQHAQFDALESRLRRREPAVLDVPLPPTPTTAIVVADGNSFPAHSFHNVDKEGENYDLEAFDLEVTSRPLQVPDYTPLYVIFKMYFSTLACDVVCKQFESCFRIPCSSLAFLRLSTLEPFD